MLYQIKRDEQIYGPYSLAEVERYLASENILPIDLAKSASMPEWIAVAELVKRQGALPEVLSIPLPETVFYSEPPVARDFQYPWFPVSPVKFAVMSLCTFGLYHLYWTYQNWNRESARTGEGLMIWVRTIFLGLFNFSLFPRIRNFAQQTAPVGWSPVFLSVVVLVFAGISRIRMPFALLSLLSFLPYLPVVFTIEKVNKALAGKVEESLNENFSAANIAGILVGGMVVLLAVIGAFMTTSPATA